MADYTISNARLFHDGNAVSFQKSPNGGARMKPLYLILHYTAGTTASGAISHFLNPKARASAHLVIDAKGEVTQMMEFNKVAWHAGKSAWADLTALNPHSIGIEIVNAGKLSKTAGGKWVTWSGKVIDDKEVIVATHKTESQPAGWHMFTEAQLLATMEIGTALRQHYGLLDVLGHDDISPKRKVDPGPAFPMISVQSRIMGRD